MCLLGSRVDKVSDPRLYLCTTVALKVRNLSLFKPSPSFIEQVGDTFIRGMDAQRAIESVVYSDSMVESNFRLEFTVP